jgi:small conductance mechanosensitive channel
MKYIENLWSLILEYSPRVITALVILIIGLFLIGIMMKMTKKVMKKRNVEITLQKFLLNLLSWALKYYYLLWLQPS